MAVDGRNRPDHAWSIAREATRGPHAGRPDCHGSSSWSWPVRGSASVEPASVTWQRYGDHGRELLFTAAQCSSHVGSRVGGGLVWDRPWGNWLRGRGREPHSAGGGDSVFSLEPGRPDTGSQRGDQR